MSNPSERLRLTASSNRDKTERKIACRRRPCGPPHHKHGVRDDGWVGKGQGNAEGMLGNENERVHGVCTVYKTAWPVQSLERLRTYCGVRISRGEFKVLDLTVWSGDACDLDGEKDLTRRLVPLYVYCTFLDNNVRLAFFFFFLTRSDFIKAVSSRALAVWCSANNVRT